MNGAARASNQDEYNLYDSGSGEWYNDRLFQEQCDTNGDLTCCDRMCQIVLDCIGIWHYSERMSFQSLCTNPDDITYYIALPANTNYFQNHALSQNPVVGLNG
jgi:hypothetical protein